MKKIIISTSLLIILGLFSCNNQEENTNEQEENSLSINEEISNESQKQIEKYPNGSTKTIGEVDEEGRRNGVWVSYFENGKKWSETNFINGLRHGHSIVFYPNGRVWYFGDYTKDKKSGEWVFYDEEGNVTKKETY